MQNYILDNITTAVVLLDGELKVRYMNAAAENLLASSLQKAYGQAINNLFCLEGKWLDDIEHVIHEKASFTSRQVSLRLTGNTQSGDGQEMTVDYTVSPVSGSTDSGAVLLEIQALDRLLRISREEALLSSEQTSRSLIRGLAHEIKNPLGGIRGAAQLLSRELEAAELKDYTQVIISEADRLRNLVDRMLGINRPLQVDPINVHEVLEHVAALAEVEVSGSIEIRRDYDPSIPNILADREQLVQVVLNIVRNAIQALSEQGAEIENPCISLKTRTQHHYTIGQQQHRLVCRVDVEDNGRGIPADIADNIFYPMISGRADGSGLGLAIAQSIVIQHKGLIECNSEPGKTVFSVYLPLEQ